MIFEKTTKKFGTVKVLVDEKDSHLLQNFSWTLVSGKIDGKPYVVFSRTKACGDLRHKKFHRVILEAPPNLVVDHINRNTLDNRRKNLRLIHKSKNVLNASKRKTAIGKYKGVHFATKLAKFIAQIQFENKKIHIGVFASEEMAARAYDAKAKELFGEYAVLNFPEENT